MVKGFLSNYFKGIAVKYLSTVETSPEISNQHEFNGIASLKMILGEARHTYESKLMYLGSDDAEIISTDCTLTWYDARENHPTRTEYRLYFQTNSILEQADTGDLLIIGLTSEDTLFVIIAKANTTYESQLLWAFGINDELGNQFKVKKIEDNNDVKLNFAFRYILEDLGIEIKEKADDYLDLIIGKFGNSFPTTRQFSAFARETFGHVELSKYPDDTIENWIDHEEMLFRTFEKYLVTDKLKKGFGEDIDEFISFSLSVQNRRKSRAGFALENHLEFIFQSMDLKYSRGEMTENRAKPDFLFPGISYYNDDNFLPSNLTMLGVKSTCKDRWRQVLSEAARIDEKHLFTLEPAISRNQTNEMVSNNLRLVIPEGIHHTYNPEQKKWLLNLAEFIDMIKFRQNVTL